MVRPDPSETTESRIACDPVAVAEHRLYLRNSGLHGLGLVSDWREPYKQDPFILSQPPSPEEGTLLVADSEFWRAANRVW